MTSEKKTVRTAVHENLVDLVLHEGTVKFLLCRDGTLSLASVIEEHDRTLVPPELDTLPHKDQLSDADEVLREYEELVGAPTIFYAALFDEVRAAVARLSHLPDDRYYDLLTAWVLHTYLHEQSEHTPIVVLFAVPERGKSRTGKGLMFLAYRGIVVNSLREPFIFRVADSLHAAMFFDISRFQTVMEGSHCEDIILGRFEKNASVPRVIYPDRGPFRDTIFFNVYGPTVIGTNQGLNHILGTRAITLTMPEASSEYATPITREAVAHVRAKLLAFRASRMGQPLPSTEKAAKSRLGDITLPLVQITTLVQPGKVHDLRALIAQVEEERIDEKSQTIHAEALKALLGCAGLVSNGRVPLERVRGLVNAGRTERTTISAPSLGRLFKSLGLSQGGRKCRTGDGKSAIPWDADAIERVCQSYGVDPAMVKAPDLPEPPAVPSETAVEQLGLGLADQEDPAAPGGTMEDRDEG
ncbi:MAG: hypothetical protein U0514_03870 [Candidatus Andersenbacteria bacterium]